LPGANTLAYCGDEEEKFYGIGTGEVDEVVAVSLVAVPVLSVAKVETGVVVLNSIAKVVDGRALVNRLSVSWLGGVSWSWNWDWDRGGLIDGSRSWNRN
jgi:hypothetical protein